MKNILLSTLLSIVLAGSVLAGGASGPIEPIKKAEKVEAPATPKEMPKVDKPKTRAEKLKDCLSKKDLPVEKCQKRYGNKKK